MKFNKIAIVTSNKAQMYAVVELFTKFDNATVKKPVTDHLALTGKSDYNIMVIENGLVVLTRPDWPRLRDYKQVKFADIHTILASVPPIEVTLNDAYVAKVTDETITVGCQTFPISVLDKLNEARKAYVNQ